MSELLQWGIVVLLWASVGLQIADYNRRKKLSAAIKELQTLIKGEKDE